MNNKIIGRRTGLGLTGSFFLTILLLVGLSIGAVFLWGNIPWFAGMVAGAIAALVFVIYGLVNLIIAPPKNLIELIDGKLFVRPKRGIEHVLELSEISRVEEKVHGMGFADSFYYGKVVIETKNQHIIVPFVAKHRKVAKEIRELLN